MSHDKKYFQWVVIDKKNIRLFAFIDGEVTTDIDKDNIHFYDVLLIEAAI